MCAVGGALFHVSTCTAGASPPPSPPPSRGRVPVSSGRLRLEPVDDLAAGGLPHAVVSADVAQHLVEMANAPGLADDPGVQMQYHQPPGGRAIGIEPVKPLAPQQVDFVDRPPSVQVDV